MKKDLSESTGISRRYFMGSTATAIAGLIAIPVFSFGAPAYLKNLGKPNSKIKGVQIGAITYSFRSMENDAESILKYCVDSGVSAIELMGYTAEDFSGAPQMHQAGSLPKREDMSAAEKKEMKEMRAVYAKKLAEWRSSVSMDKFKQLRKMYKDAGVSIYAWKPSALGISNTDAEIDYACRAAKVLGADHVTIELPKDNAHTQRLGNLASKHKIKVGYHGHLQQTFTSWDEALNQSKYNALNCDIGHYVAAGFDPLPLLKAKHAQIVSMHIKDRQSKANGQANLPWGQGDTPLVEVLRLMRDQKYKFPATIELEYKIPEESDAVKEVAKCLEFCRKALES
jgi:sugar phosphate isomerase/epimerase